MDPLKRLSEDIAQCQRCPRLIRHCQKMAQLKKREYREHDYWGKPVPGFGDPMAWLWIVGLAPAAHGANRTGRMFTGDSSGNWLYRALHQVGLANQALSRDRKDGLVLRGVYISAAARCAPPDNKPTRGELKRCFSYLEEEWELLPRVSTILALGKIAFDTTLALLEKKKIPLNPKPKFAHHMTYPLGEKTLVASYHPSRQNTQTGRLTEKMWLSVFEGLENHPTRKGNFIRPLQADRLEKPLTLCRD